MASIVTRDVALRKKVDEVQQYAALPWRQNGQLEIMLISSRDTGRWVIPKGWPIPELMPHESAAREAFEEAGIEGGIGTTPIGRYSYVKRLKAGKTVTCDVSVFAFRVTRQLEDWPERGQRTIRWFRAAEAATLVEEPELAALMRSFAGLD
jgi:8-oxo-dGTP pyrophosphatase MutT (NUDIX family)